MSQTPEFIKFSEYSFPSDLWMPRLSPWSTLEQASLQFTFYCEAGHRPSGDHLSEEYSKGLPD